MSRLSHLPSSPNLLFYYLRTQHHFNQRPIDLDTLLDSCSGYDIGNCKLVSKIHCCRLNQLKSRVTLPHYAGINFRAIRHLNFDLIMSLKVECDGGIGLTIYDLLLIFNSNIWPNSAPLRDISFQNLTDLDSDLERSLWSNLITPTDSPYMYMLSYWCLMVIYGPTLRVYKIQSLETWVILTLTFHVTQCQMWWCHLTLHIWFPIDICILVTACLSLTV